MPSSSVWARTSACGRSTWSSASGTPSARPIDQASAMIARIIAEAAAEARMSPTVSCVAAVTAENATSSTYFSHFVAAHVRRRRGRRCHRRVRNVDESLHALARRPGLRARRPRSRARLLRTTPGASIADRMYAAPPRTCCVADDRRDPRLVVDAVLERQDARRLADQRREAARRLPRCRRTSRGTGRRRPARPRRDRPSPERRPSIARPPA